MPETRTWTLASHPEGVPDPEKDFKLVTSNTPDLADGEFLAKTLFLSVDPYMRGRMRKLPPGEKSYIPGFEIGDPIVGTAVCQVTESKSSTFKVGDHISGMFPWADYVVAKESPQIQNLDSLVSMGLSPSLSLGVMGMPGITAFFGFVDICEPKEGETVVVTGAGGAVGSLVCQIAKIKGCKVIAIAGTQDKLDLVKSYGVEHTVNYKTTKDMKATIKELAPEGVNCYFDNVGGEIYDAVIANMATFGRISCCGAISTYNMTTEPVGPRDNGLIIGRSLKKQGFICTNYLPRIGEFLKEMGPWVGQGKIKSSETFREGLENTPKAFCEMMAGANIGKMIVKL